MVTDEMTDGRATGPGPLVIGTTGGADSSNDLREYFRGNLAEVIAFDRALGPDERLSLCSAVRLLSPV
jgi:hypothetical protein